MQQAHTLRAIIAYEDLRQSQQIPTPTLLIHGAGDTHLEWAPELRAGLAAITPDLPGHGDSPAPGRDSIEAYAEDMLALLDFLQIERTVLVGHSMGSAISLMMALMYPQRVAALVLIGSGAALPVNAAIIAGMETNPLETTAMITKWSWAKDTEPAIRVASHERLLRTPAQITRDDFIACDRFNLRERAPEITRPALIMTGSADRMTPLPMAQELAAILPHASLITIENGSHRVAQEQPAAVLLQIQQWLATQ